MAFLVTLPGYIYGQAPGQRGAAPLPTAKATAPIDLTGYWVSVVSEDWRWRMVTPQKGSYPSVPLNAEGRKIADSWDPAKDEAEGNQCKAYGAANILRMPTRLHITWENDNALRVDADAGTQTRLFQFGNPNPPSGPATWQGDSVAKWEYGGFGAPPSPSTPHLNSAGKPRGGSLKVVSNHLRPGYLQKNGVPYGANTVVTEYLVVPKPTANGDVWLIVTTVVDDPQYLAVAPPGREGGGQYGPMVRTSNFKKLPNANGWNPTPCSVR